MTPVVSTQHPAQRLLDQRLGVDVERRQGVVEHEHGGLATAPRGRARAAAAGRRTATSPARRSGCRDPTAGRGRSRPGRRRAPPRSRRRSRRARPRVRFSRALIENSVGSSNAVATSWRRWARSRSRTSTPSIVTAPAGHVEQPRHQRGQAGLAGPGGADDGDRLARADVEVDVAQHRLVERAGEARSRRARSAGGRGAASIVRVPLTMSDSVSKISRIRAAEVIASCAIARMMPSDETGHTSESISVMNATSSPGVSAPRPTPIAPNSRTTTTAQVGDHLEEGPEPRREPDLVHRRRVQLAGGGFVLVADVAAAGRTT